MPWLILHRCTASDSEPRPYGLVKTKNGHGEPVTLAKCSEECKEQLIFEGHGPFDEAVTAQQVQGSHMPPGFVVARAVRD